MAEQTKKIVSVEILHLDELGYGPEGKHTRREWRDECLENLLAGKEQFLAWQKSWQPLAKANQRTVSFARKVTYSDGLVETLDFLSSMSHCLDFVKQNFEKLDCEYFEFLFPTFFSSAKFFECALFTRTTISDFVNFGMTEFFGYTDFGYSEFRKDTYFNKAHFFDCTRFDGIKFLDIAEFDSVSFTDEVTFCNTHFLKKANFQSAQFEDKALFASTNFNEMVVLTNSEFRKQSIFLDAKFKDHSDFENVIFDNIGHFQGAKFLQLFPDFRGCKIDATRLEFSDESHFPQTDFTEDAINNISFLKRLSDEHGQKDQALEFNAMELRAKRLNLLNTVLLYEAPDRRIFLSKWWETRFTLFYEKVSDFGRSFTKPFFWLLVVLVISFIFGLSSAYFHPPSVTENTEQVANSNSDKYISLSASRAATEYSLYRSGNFLDFSDADKNTASINMRLFGSEIEPWWARIFGFVKGIITAILLFLIALGLRNKYRVS